MKTGCVSLFIHPGLFENFRWIWESGGWRKIIFKRCLKGVKGDGGWIPTLQRGGWICLNLTGGNVVMLRWVEPGVMSPNFWGKNVSMTHEKVFHFCKNFKTEGPKRIVYTRGPRIY